MADPVETTPASGQALIEQAKVEVQQEINDAGNAQDKINLLVVKLQQELIRSETGAKEAAKAEQEGRFNDKRIEANQSLKTLVRVAEAVKKGIPVVPVGSRAEKILTSLVDKLTPAKAAMIQTHMQSVLCDQTTDKIQFSSAGQPKTEFEKSLLSLRLADSSAADMIDQILIDKSAELGKTQDEMRQIITEQKQEGQINQLQEIGQRRKEAHEEHNVERFEANYAELFGTYFPEKEQKDLVYALYNPEQFVKFVAAQKKKFAASIKPNYEDLPLTEEENFQVNQKLSDEIKAQVGELYAKIYHKLDEEHAKEFFEEISKKDFYHGIERASQELSRVISNLGGYLSSHQDEQEIKEILGNTYFIRDCEEEPLIERIKVDIKEGEKKIGESEKTRIRIRPLLKPEKTGIAEYVKHLHLVMGNYIGFRGYTHNARALFFHPPGKEGFYHQLGEFSEKYGMIDFDEMMLLPDAQVFQRAFNLYDKFLDEKFALNNWHHTPEMFEHLPNQLLTRMEMEVLDQLKNSYRDKNGKLTVSEDRLRSALNSAIGAARGILMTEPEKASSADPPLTVEGGATFQSYYTNDASALTAFNPISHFPGRFQTEGAQYHSIFFLPVEELEAGFGKAWDHTEILKKMQAYRESWLKGRSPIGKEQLVIDWCANIGEVGGPFKRMGWRSNSWFTTHYKYKDSDNTNLDCLKTWKGLEHIGYEAVCDAVKNVHKGITDKFLTSNKSEDVADKKALFEYIFEKYYGQKDMSQLNAYMTSLRDSVRPVVLKKIEQGKIAPTNIDNQVELEASRMFLYRALSRVIGQRMPTKFIRIDRDRLSENGTSRWKALRQSLGNMDESEYDKIIKDLLLAEDELRKVSSDTIRKKLNILKKTNKNAELRDVILDGDDEHKLTRDKIRVLLKGKFVLESGQEDTARIDKAILLYDKLQEMYSNNPEFLDNFAVGIQKGVYKFTFAIDETDLTLVPFRSAGPRVLARAVKDVAGIEQDVSAMITGFPELLKQVSLSGKTDFSEIIKQIDKAKKRVSGVLGPDDAARIAHHFAAMTIAYFKKDTSAKVAFGIFGLGRENSIAATYAGRGSRVWEWDARDIDAFCVALESNDILKKKPILFSTSKPTYEPHYIKIPFINKLIRLPKQFDKRVAEIKWTSDNLRKEFGGTWGNILFEMIQKYGPIVILILLWKFFQDALDEGKKK